MPHLQLTREDALAVLTFDREGSSANLFDRATLEELRGLLDQIAEDPSIEALLIRSAKPSIFIAGADLTQLSRAQSEELASLIELGQTTFNRLEDLKIPTAAAIRGACVGGGLELALACDWRAASDSSKTRIGLPETRLGILPAWGGSTRLPRLLGLADALPLILGGSLLSAEAARRKGVVDGVAPDGREEVLARQLLARGKRKPEHHPLQHNPAAAAVIRARAGHDLKEKTRGHYPGPAKALEVACEGIFHDRARSLELERQGIVELACLPETKQLIRLFFLQERAKKARPNAAEPRPIRQLGVIGAGIMGSGIAYWASTRGLEVTLSDISWDALAAGQEKIGKLYAEAAQRHVLSGTRAARGLDRIHPGTGEIPLTRCDLVIEAAVEELPIKQRIFADLSRRSRPDTLLATNTSALPIRELIPHIDHPERLLGLHFFNPVHRMQLVEVVRTDSTSDETLATGVAFVRAIGKLPIVVADSPGFLVNRILLPYLVEAARLFAQGGEPEQIDEAMLDFGMPMGPLRLLDEVGLDVGQHVARTLAAAFPDRMQVPAIVDKLLQAGLTGRKGGAGFYLYDPAHKDRPPRPNPKALELRDGGTPAPADTAAHLAHLMHEEARRCLDEGVVESPDDIDLAMILGTGYAPFRGGPMQG